MSYLYGYTNSKETVENKPRFPKIWLADRTVQDLSIGKRHVGFFSKSYYFDNFPNECFGLSY